MDNPLPASTGRVCQHPCENRCRRQTVDEPINMREVHRVIADSVLMSDQFDAMAAKVVARRLAPTGKTVAVAGGGPAGLTAAFYLALARPRSHRVRIPCRGRRHAALRAAGIPAAPRCARSARSKSFAGSACNSSSTPHRDRCFAGRSEAKFDAVFLSIGTWKETQSR